MVLVILGALIPPATAGARPLVQSAAATCYGVPSKVAPSKAGGVRAGTVNVHCAGTWSAFQGIQWWTKDGKWSYGGTRTVTGRGNTIVAPWHRPYYGCGWWRQEWRTAGASRYSQAERFCSERTT